MNNNKLAFRKQLIGGALVFFGAIFFSAKAVLVKLAYQYEVESSSLLALRMLFSLPFYLLLAWYAGRRKERLRLNRKDWLQIITYGVVGYYLASLLDFYGLRYVSASMERLILFLYPTLVVLLSFFFWKKPVFKYQLIALVLTYIGIGMAFYEGLQLADSSNFALGAFLIFLCALTYAFYLIGSGELIPKLGTIRYTSLAMTMACLAVLLHNLIEHQWDLMGFHPRVYQYAVLMAVLSTVIPSFMISGGIKLVGASNASIVGSVGPISTIVLAYIFLDERLGVLQIAGTVLVIGGVLLITLRRT